MITSSPKIADNIMVVNTSQEELEDSIQDLMKVLSDREKHVISHRYALFGNKKFTLSEIGNHFNVTRERIRQIENYALKKLHRVSKSNQIVFICDFVKELLVTHGGIMSQNRVINELDRFLPNLSKILVSELKFIICLDNQIVRTGNTIDYHPHFRLHDMTMENIVLVSKTAIDFLNQKKLPISLASLIDMVQDEIGFDHPIFKGSFIKACLQIDKRIKVFEGQVSLFGWSHINPKTLREKINYVLRHANRPLHFMDISEEITKKHFNNRVVNLQAVHNELINCDDFVLIGRGIYALSEWGYDSGTVADVISGILDEKGPMFVDQVIKNVLDRRQVKRVTVSINLKNKNLFKKLADGRYALR